MKGLEERRKEQDITCVAVCLGRVDWWHPSFLCRTSTKVPKTLRKNEKEEKGIKDRREMGKGTNLLTMESLDLLSLGAMGKGGVFVVETMEAMGFLVDKGVILGNELPADLGRDDVGVAG